MKTALALIAGVALTGPVAAQTSPDLFLGEKPDGGLIDALRDCALDQQIGVALECRMDLNFACIDVGTRLDICMLREAAAWELVMEEALTRAGARLQAALDADAAGEAGEDELDGTPEAADPETPQEATALAQMLVSQAAFVAYRAVQCDALALPYRPSEEADRTYALCLIDMAAQRVMLLDNWGKE